MTPSELKREVERRREEAYFFTRNNMKFAGDTMRNYGVRAKPVQVETYSQGIVECWELYRKRTTPKGFSDSAYFACDDFRCIFPK